jgi:hypothetical protein
MNKQLLFAVLILAYALPACQSSDRSSSKAVAFSPKLKLTPGQRFDYSITHQVVTKAEIEGREMVTDNRIELGLLYEMISDTAGQVVMKLTYNNLKVRLKDHETEEVYDASNSRSEVPVEKILSQIRGSSVLVYLSSRGEVIKIEGVSEISKGILASFNATDAQSQQQLKQHLSKLVGETFVRENLQSAFAIAKDTLIQPGSTWTASTTTTSDIRYDASTTYKLISVTNNVATIEAMSEIKNVTAATAITGYDTQQELKGKEEGTFKTDIVSGMIMSGDSDAMIEGKLNVMERQVPLTIEITRKIRAKKAN